MSLSNPAQKNSALIRSSLPSAWLHALKFNQPGPIALWLLANLFDTLTTLIGLARGHIELNLFAASLGQALGPYAMFISKWLVVITLIWLVRASRHRHRLNFCLARTMSISTVVVWLGVGWNLVMLYFFG